MTSPFFPREFGETVAREPESQLGPADIAQAVRKVDFWAAKRIIQRVIEETYRQGCAAGYEKAKSEKEDK